jgi:hypothetical protein
MVSAPTATKSMRIAFDDLGLAKLHVIYPGKRSYPLDEKLEVVSIVDLPARLEALNGPA